MKKPFDEQTMRGHSHSRYFAGRKVFGDRFLLERQIGRGGMGEVWLAVDAELSQKRAIKFLPPEIAADERAVGQLRREARAGMELAHPRIVRTNDFHCQDDDAGVVMEYVEGRTMSALQADQEVGFLEVGEIKAWMVDVLDALRYAHGEMSRVHRDIKPQNIIVETASGRAKLMDFGISRRISDTHSMLTGSDNSGTLAYASPQQVMGDPPSATDDIYSLGATLFDLLTGTPPFFRGDLRMQVRRTTPPSMAERRKELVDAGMIGGLGEEISAPWEQLVAACLAKETAERPQTIGDFKAMLEGRAVAPAAKAAPVVPPTLPPQKAPAPAPVPVKKVQPTPAVRPAPQPVVAPEPTAPQQPKSRSGLKVLVGVLLVAVAGAGGYVATMMMGGDKPDPLPVVSTPSDDTPLVIDTPVIGGKPAEPDEPEVAAVEVPTPAPTPVPEPSKPDPPKPEPPEPEPPKQLTREELVEKIGEVSKIYVLAGNTGSGAGQETIFADRLNYFGSWMSKFEATSRLKKHQESWPQRKYTPEVPEVILAADGRSAEVKIWMSHVSENSEKKSSGRVLNRIKWQVLKPFDMLLIEEEQLARMNSKTEFKDGAYWVGGADDQQLRASVEKMALEYYRAGSTNSNRNQIAMLAARVNYFDKGVVNRSVARSDLASYEGRWPNRIYRADRAESVRLDGDKRGARVTVWFEMDLSNRKERATGTMEGHLRIRWDRDGRAEITEAKSGGNRNYRKVPLR